MQDPYPMDALLQQAMQQLAVQTRLLQTCFAPLPAAVPAQRVMVACAAAAGDGVAAVLDLLHARLGFRPAAQLEAKVASLVAALGDGPACALAARLALLDVRHPDWVRLIEATTVHETYFYRDGEQLERLAGQHLPALIDRAAASGRRLRLWSAGCSSGEEAYTLAMLTAETLAAAGEAWIGDHGTLQILPGWDVQVLGTDVSPAVVAAARRGQYRDLGLSPFRQLPERHRKFLIPEPGIPPAWEVRDEIRALVRFETANLMQPMPGPFDVILCRNVLIYFGEDGRRQVIRNLHAALAEDGVLVLGPTDVLDCPDLFRPAARGSSPLYLKGGREGRS